MERNVVTLETARNLKAAGFPESVELYWRHDGFDWGLEWEPTDENSIPAPMAQEIADRLPEGRPLGAWQHHLNICKINGSYIASYDQVTANGYDRMDSTQGGLMAEALGLLWLKLQEVK